MKKTRKQTWLVTYYCQDIDDYGCIRDSVKTERVDEKELAWFKENNEKSMGCGMWFKIWDIKPWEKA